MITGKRDLFCIIIFMQKFSLHNHLSFSIIAIIAITIIITLWHVFFKSVIKRTFKGSICVTLITLNCIMREKNEHVLEDVCAYVRIHYRREFMFGLSLRIFTPPVSSRVRTGGERTPRICVYADDWKWPSFWLNRFNGDHNDSVKKVDILSKYRIKCRVVPWHLDIKSSAGRNAAPEFLVKLIISQ